MSGPRAEEARRWFHQARYDLAAARWNIDGGFNDTACFLAQQSAEKALKSVLHFLRAGRSRLLGHSVAEMLKTAARKIPGAEDLLESGRELDMHYIPARYPNGLPDGFPHRFYSRDMAERAVAAADRILGFTEQYYSSQGMGDILNEEE
jgi:HEPN domain-containing protein